MSDSDQKYIDELKKWTEADYKRCLHYDFLAPEDYPFVSTVQGKPFFTDGKFRVQVDGEWIEIDE